MAVSFTLNNGVEIPAIGFGTWGGESEESRRKIKNPIVTALKSGYRHIDTAWVYGTESVVAEALRESGVRREDVFITSKSSWIHHKLVKRGFEQTLASLGTDYLDLYLIHWPFGLVYKGDDVPFPKDAEGNYIPDHNVSFVDSWGVLEELYASGKVRAIGVSNFSVKTLEELARFAKVVPAVNQLELHPYLSQEDVREYCAKKGIHLTAYTPTGSGPVRADPVLHELAEKYKATVVQVNFAWHIARGGSLCTFSKDPERQRQCLDLPRLDPADVERINKLNKNQRVCNFPDADGYLFGWTKDQLGW